MTVPRIDVDLRRPPAVRWAGLQPYAGDARHLFEQYAADLGGIAQFHDMIVLYRDACVDADYIAELAAVAGMLGISPEALFTINLYYDAIKFNMGCTAFAVDSDRGPLHARNLDWWTENNLLSRSTIQVHMHGGAEGPFQLVSWPGFTGALSGMALGRFAITLNAVLSDEPAAFAPPIAYVLRSTFEQARTFDEAVERLSTVEIASDCLLLMTGTQPGEMVVIERTPTRSALRHPVDGRLVVANEYLAMPANNAANTGQELQRTSCDRFDRATTLLGRYLPPDASACFDILTDPAVRMDITVQHMVLSAAEGLVEVRLPEQR